MQFITHNRPVHCRQTTRQLSANTGSDTQLSEVGHGDLDFVGQYFSLQARLQVSMFGSALGPDFQNFLGKS